MKYFYKDAMEAMNEYPENSKNTFYYNLNKFDVKLSMFIKKWSKIFIISISKILSFPTNIVTMINLYKELV
jgi:hypothetical protein